LLKLLRLTVLLLGPALLVLQRLSGLLLLVGVVLDLIMVAAVAQEGIRTGTGLSVTAGTTYTLLLALVAQDATVLAGTGVNGGDSSIAGAPISENPAGAGTNTLKAYGGGGGGSMENANAAGANGGSGGGGGAPSVGATTRTGGTGNTPSTTPSQGNARSHWK
jgi:hypothetical protein